MSASHQPLGTRLAALRSAQEPSSPPLTTEVLLSAFLEEQRERQVNLYPAQEEAILELSEGHHVVLGTPTGSGKSLVATFVHFLALGRQKRSFYTCPIKALVSEKFFALCETFGASEVGMLTGDASINPNAKIICCTAEVLAQMSIHGGHMDDIADVVMDEFHYFGDSSRGRAWELPLLCLPRTRFLLMSATLGDIQGITSGLTQRTGRQVVSVLHAQRPIPLEFRYSEIPLTETLNELLSGGGSPVYVVHFTQREAVEAATATLSLNFLSKEQKADIAATIGSFRFDTPFGKLVSRCLHHGVGIHHAGLLPKYRLLTEKLAQKGVLRVLMGTDTLGVGINVPIRTVVFTQLCKYDGQSTKILGVREFKQIAGRAGRAGFDTLGTVVCQAPEHVIENRRMTSRVGDDPKKLRKLVKKKPPSKNFVPWDAQTMERLISSAPEPLESQFSIDFGLVLESMRHHPQGYRQVAHLIAASHLKPRQKTSLRRRGRNIFKTLRQAVVLERHKDEEKRPYYSLAAHLGDDFSLTHTLFLFVLEMMPALVTRPDHSPLDTLSLIESILENPYAILNRQTDLAKRRRLDALKAEGVPYEDRIAELDEVTYEKPLADELYTAFNRWQEQHPTARDLNVAPKSIARAMTESFATFNDYVKELGLERSEGLLLRYLSQVLDALAGAVAAEHMNEPLADVVAYLEESVQHVDASLTTEWERIASGVAPQGPKIPTPPPSPLALLRKQPRVIAARIRQRLYALVRALAAHAWDEAENFLRLESSTSRPSISSLQVLEEACLRLEAEFGPLDASPAARLGSWTRIREETPSTYAVSHTLLFDGEALGPSLELTFDLADLLEAGQPALVLHEIGSV